MRDTERKLHIPFSAAMRLDVKNIAEDLSFSKAHFSDRMFSLSLSTHDTVQIQKREVSQTNT
jgi:hypothetical protein